MTKKGGTRFREKHGIILFLQSLLMGVAGRLVKDKGRPLLYEAFSSITKRNPSVYPLVAWDQVNGGKGRQNEATI